MCSSSYDNHNWNIVLSQEVIWAFQPKVGVTSQNDAWVTELERLNSRFREVSGDGALGDPRARRALLEQRVGRIRPLRRLSGKELEDYLGGRPLVGVDGSINTFGGQYPHYVDFLRALAKPSAGQPLVLKQIHSPIPGEEDPRRNDQEVRQQKLAELEVMAAIEVAKRLQPAVILMDGPLVRFDMRARESFRTLYDLVAKNRILLTGCIENIESRVISTMLGPDAPSGWKGRYDYDILWETLEPGEVLEVGSPVKGMFDEEAKPIRTWFMRPSLAPGVVGMEMVDDQAGFMGALADYLYTLTPPDGRGIPIWIDIVDREVRLTDVELEAYLQLLDPSLRRVFASKREARIF